MFHDEESGALHWAAPRQNGAMSATKASLDTWYLLTSADHNTLQVNEIDKKGSVGKQVSTLSESFLL